MKIRLARSSLAIIAALTGCASSNDSLTANVNPRNGAPTYHSAPVAPPPERSPYEARADAIFQATDAELQALTSYAKVPNSVVSSVDVQRVGLSTKVTVAATSPKGFFPPGTYRLSDIKRTEDRGGVAFIDIASNAVRQVLDRIKDRVGGQLDVSIGATYSAQADGLPPRNLRYKGEFGDTITLPAEVTTVNGKAADVNIAKGQAIDNNQLAALRAVSLASFLHGALNPHPVSDRFVLTTTDQVGLQYRWVKVEITLTPAL